VRAHHGEASVDDATLALQELVDGRAHVVVDAAVGHAAERCEAARVRIDGFAGRSGWVILIAIGMATSIEHVSGAA